MPRVIDPVTVRIARAAGLTREQVRDWSKNEIENLARSASGRVAEAVAETEGAVLASGCAEELLD